MINSQGIIQNNKCVTDLLKDLKNSKTQYKTLKKDEERDMIEKYLKENREDELRKLLIMHNIRLVFSIAKRYCKQTRDFDNMVAKGLFGLTFAANTFNFFEPVTYKVQVGTKIARNKKYPFNPIVDEKTGLVKEEPVFIKKIKINPKTCLPNFVKFCTFANYWIFKYVMDEFNDVSIKIDNNSFSLDDKVKIKNSYDNNQNMENYIHGMMHPDYDAPRKFEDLVSDDEVVDFYSKIGEFLVQTNELTAIEKKVITDTFYNNRKAKDIAEELGESSQIITIAKKKALNKIKNYLIKNFHIEKIEDLISI